MYCVGLWFFGMLIGLLLILFCLLGVVVVIVDVGLFEMDLGCEGVVERESVDMMVLGLYKC